MEDIQSKGKKLIDKLSNSLRPKFQGQGHKLGGSELPSSSKVEGIGGSSASQAAVIRSGGKTITPKVGPRESKTAENTVKKQENSQIAPSNVNLETKDCQSRESERQGESSKNVSVLLPEAEEGPIFSEEDPATSQEISSAIEEAAALFFSESPPPSSVDILKKLLGNILNDPSAEKFRRIRLSNPKINAAVGEAIGGIELLQASGFELTSEDSSASDLFATMPQVASREIFTLRKALQAIESFSQASTSSAPSARPTPRKRDRNTRVFLPAEENLARRIEIPDSFYELSAMEARALVSASKQSLQKSRELSTRSWKEKQSASNKRRCKVAILRVQLPDMMILEGQFFPSEPTSALYQFVAEALQNPAAQFDLVFPLPPRNPVLPSVAAPGSARMPTLEEAELVPSALIRLRPLQGSGPAAGFRLREELASSAQVVTSSPKI